MGRVFRRVVSCEESMKIDGSPTNRKYVLRLECGHVKIRFGCAARVECGACSAGPLWRRGLELRGAVRV